MDRSRSGLEDEEDDDDDEDVQVQIEQSLLESSRKEQPTAGNPPGSARRRITAGRTDGPEEEALGAESTSLGVAHIFSAIKRGDETLLKDLSVQRKDDFLRTDGRGWTALHQAATQSNQAVLELTLRASGPDCVERGTPEGRTPLFLAVESGLKENAALLLERGAKPDCQDRDRDAPLFAAVRSGRTDLVKLLIRGGSSVNQAGYHGRRPLHEASRGGSVELVKLLLEAGATSDPRSDYGFTPLALAAQGGHLEVVELLLRRGADVLSQAHDEASVLYEAAASGNPAVIALLLEHGADANVSNHTGHLPIHRASHRGHLQCLQLLLPVTNMADVKDSGISPLHSAAAEAHSDCIQALLEAGYDPNYMLHPWIRRSYDDERKSALFFAVSNNDMKSVTLLLEAGAMANQDPVKCLQVALRLGNYHLIHLLLRYGANVNYYSRINTTHFPSALLYALKDQVVLRMLCNYGYDMERCFDCPYGSNPHVPEDYEGWTCSVIKDTLFCEVITVYWLRDLSGQVVRVLLDYMDHAPLCCKLKAALMEQPQWAEICRLQENPRRLQHLCRLRIRRSLGRLRLRSPVFMSFLPLPPRLKDYVLYREYDLLAGSD